MARRLSREERETFLRDVHVGVISIAVDDDRGPLAVPIWYRYEPDEGVSVLTVRTSRKGRAIEAAGRFTLVAQREAMPYTYVTVEGPVVDARPMTDDDLRATARRYFGPVAGDAYAATFPPDDSATFVYTMRPERWASYTEAGRSHD